MRRAVMTTVAVMCTGALGLIAGCEKDGTQANTQTVADRCEHEIKTEKCPFCTPELIETDGFCGEHGVAEALCAQCRPYLKAVFREKGDWCAEHAVPESQCIQCNPELAEKIQEGVHGGVNPADTTAAADACEHQISEAKCPFCTPELIETDGFCGGHGVAEALCVKCRPYLEVAFKANGDWCAEHETPESQCAECNPDLKKEGGAG